MLIRIDGLGDFHEMSKPKNPRRLAALLADAGGMLECS
jgi:hypothetical protein